MSAQTTAYTTTALLYPTDKLLREAIKFDAVTRDARKFVTPPHPVSAETYKELRKTFIVPEEEGWVHFTTPEEDMRLAEAMLQVAPGFFNGAYVVKTKAEHEFCGSCGRRNNFLDVIFTGLNVHKPEFLVDVFSGKYGNIHNSNDHQYVMCYGCRHALPSGATKFLMFDDDKNGDHVGAYHFHYCHNS